MKKKSLTLLASCILVMANAFSQEEKSITDSAKRAYNYFVKIETMSNEKIDAALSRFSDDSVFIIPVEKKHIFISGTTFKIIRNEEESGIAAESIKLIHIKKDRNIIYADSLKKRKSKAIVRSIAFSALAAAFSGAITPAVAVPSGIGLEGLAALNTVAIVIVSAAVVGGTLAVTTTGNKFKLNGDKEKYKEMLLDITNVKKIHVENNTENTNKPEN